jgi:hypothetical protein
LSGCRDKSNLAAVATFDPGGLGGFASVGRLLAAGPVIDLFIPVSPAGLHHSWYGPTGWHRTTSGELQLQPISAKGDDQPFSHQPSAVSGAPDRLDVFAVSDGGDLWHFWAEGEQQPPSSWVGETLGHPVAGGLISAPAAVAQDEDKITVLARSAPLGTLMACVWDPAAGEHWTWRDPVDELGWAKQPSEFVFAPAACAWGPDRIDVFCVSGTSHAGTLQHTWQQDFPDTPAWHPDYWEQLNAYILTSNPAAVSWSEPRQLFVIYRNVAGIDGSSVGMTSWLSRHPTQAFFQIAAHFYLDWERRVVYQQSSSEDAVLSHPTLASAQKNRLDAFWIRSDLRLQHGWINTAATMKDWSWEDLAVAWPSS